jgi:hypothetical protein
MNCIKTELYFGEDEPGGKHVGPKAWREFLRTEVTPRFPKGLTVLEGYGQMQHRSGRIERQPSRVVTIVHQAGSDMDKRITAVIAAYRARFENAQVMHLRTPVRAEFFAD